MTPAANSKKTAKKKRGRPWQPGQSGNPSGRPKKTPEQREIEELARTWSKRAMNRLGKIATKGEDKDAVRACEAILDRGFGRARQQVDVGVTMPSGVVILPAEEIDELRSNGAMETESRPAASVPRV
jgi:hypothetical protein